MRVQDPRALIFFGTSAFHWVKAVKYINTPIFVSVPTAPSSPLSILDKFQMNEYKVDRFHAHEEMRTSNIYAVQRHGNTFDTCRSLLGIHQLTLHHRRIEPVASDIQQVSKLNRARIIQPPGFQDTSLLTPQHATCLAPKFRNPMIFLSVSLGSRL
ncbi:hypothetical protein N7447_008882 [Penicillium robsamsonii]|uniref:uncharacterized protein n=1 Tax=Penicillium robsamsonii TaxID=1792511 RepID=UPI002549657F|nr:uncharacterized protein N7447_008882 [Penicillium robsamsonii]KAJ5816649.1 hypothetical protein N7447_008882 [Penicillium robsamsonii]